MTIPAKKYRASIFWFSFIGLLLLAGISWLIDFGVKHSDVEQTGKVNKIINHNIDPGIIVFGSSASEVGLSAPIIQARTHMTAYNCSMNGTRFMQYKGLIDEFGSYSKANKYVILVETYFSFEKTDALAFPDRYLAQINNQRLFNSLYCIQPGLAWKCRYVPFYKYVAASHIYYKNAVSGWKNFLKRGQADTSLGYAPVDSDWQTDADEAIKNTAHFDIGIDSTTVACYRETVQQLMKSGKKVIIVLMPMYTEMLKRVTDITPLCAKLNEMSVLTGARFLDFSKSGLCAEKQFFYNSNHLNLKGSAVFSNVLADSLNEIIQPGRLAGAR